MSEAQNESASTPKKAPAEVEKVAMSDGRTVEFVGKRKLLKEAIVAEDGSASVRFDFRNGQTRTFEVPQSLFAKFAAHGASQKIGDETAGETDVDDMVVAVDDIISRLNTGEWGAERKAGGGFAGAGIVIRALTEVTGKSVEDVKAWIEDKIKSLGCTRQALYASLRNPSSTIGKKIAELELEKKSKEAKFDADELMSELTQ